MKSAATDTVCYTNNGVETEVESHDTTFSIWLYTDGHRFRFFVTSKELSVLRDQITEAIESDYANNHSHATEAAKP